MTRHRRATIPPGAQRLAFEPERGAAAIGRRKPGRAREAPDVVVVSGSSCIASLDCRAASQLSSEARSYRESHATRAANRQLKVNHRVTIAFQSRHKCERRLTLSSSVESISKEEAMQVPSVLTVAKRCAYCSEPFRITEQGIEAYRVADQYVCNEFCAQAISKETSMRRHAP